MELHDEGQGNGGASLKWANHEHIQATQTVWMYKASIPQDIWDEIEEVEREF